MSDEISTVLETATLLEVADKTVYTMAQKGEIPAVKVGGQWWFRRRHRSVDSGPDRRPTPHGERDG